MLWDNLIDEVYMKGPHNLEGLRFRVWGLRIRIIEPGAANTEARIGIDY